MLETPAPPFPHVALLVSGGHTMLIEVRGIGDYRMLGQTRDDAAGEAFDKSAKLLGLPYPGGPELAQLAASGRPGRYSFPRPMLDRPGFEFSFSGLKTAVMQAVRAGALSDQGARTWPTRCRMRSSRPCVPRRCGHWSTPGIARWWWRAASAPIASCARG